MRSTLIKPTGILMVLCFVAAMAYGCASAPVNPGDEGKIKVLDRKALDDPPTYRQLASSLEYYEEKLGIKFYKNEKGRYLPYSTSGWQSFTIADELNECLYDINMKGLITYRYLEGKLASLIEMEIDRGPCGIRYPEADVVAVDKVTLQEGSVMSPIISEQIKGGIKMYSGAKFLQEILQVPWKVDSIEGGLENSVAKVGLEVKNALDITYGDVVFFTEYYGERSVGIYVDYGVIVTNSCFRAQARKMDSRINYRIYRIFTGFNMVQYKVHEEKWMKDFVGRPE